MNAASPIAGYPPQRILVVDDELNIRGAMVRTLTLLGYGVDEAESGRQALAKLERQRYDALLLDINMPDLNGMDVMQAIQSRNLDIAIVVLTGHGSLDSAIAAIHADDADYLIKPASIVEIRDAFAILFAKRHREQQAQNLLKSIGTAVQELQDLEVTAAPPVAVTVDRFVQAGPLLLDRQQRTVMHLNEQLYAATLPVSEANILETLMRHPNHLLSCRQLAAALDYDVEEFEAEELVRPHLSRLRQHLSVIPGAAEMIQTVRGRGYQFSLG